MKFGDIMINTSASLRNPNRKFMVINTTNLWINGINSQGSSVFFNKSMQKKDNFLKKIGEINIKDQINMFKDDGEIFNKKRKLRNANN